MGKAAISVNQRGLWEKKKHPKLDGSFQEKKRTHWKVFEPMAWGENYIILVSNLKSPWGGVVLLCFFFVLILGAPSLGSDSPLTCVDGGSAVSASAVPQDQTSTYKGRPCLFVVSKWQVVCILHPYI